jgi:hypothetical protein
MDGFDVKVQPVLGELRPVRHEPEVDLERATVDRSGCYRLAGITGGQPQPSNWGTWVSG